jgi:hypothetical protein
VPERKKPDLLHAMDQRRKPRTDSRAAKCLQTERTAPQTRDEGVPLNGSEPEDSTLRVLAVPDMNARAGRGLQTGAATIAAPTASPLSARVVIVIANVISTRHGRPYYAPPATLVVQTATSDSQSRRAVSRISSRESSGDSAASASAWKKSRKEYVSDSPSI